MAHIGDRKRALFEETTNANGKYYVMTRQGSVVLDQVAAYVTECLDRMEAHVMPCKEASGDLPIRCFNR